MTTPFFFIRTPNFLPRLDVLIFSAISASKCSYDVLNYFTLKIKYLHSTTVYFILNITVFSLSYNMNWSWKECNRILYWPKFWPKHEKKISPPKIEAGHVLMMFLFFLGFQPGCSYKRCSYKKKKVYKILLTFNPGEGKVERVAFASQLGSPFGPTQDGKPAPIPYDRVTINAGDGWGTHCRYRIRCI